MRNKKLSGIVLAAIVSVSVLVPSVQADDDDYRHGRMMGYGGMGMMDGSGGGPGYGGGMMGGGYGMGMMGGGYGGGMMGYGHMGMGGYGMGAMYGPMHMLGLSDAQRKKANAINDATRKQNWDTMGKIMDESSKLRDLYAVDRPDVNKISAAYDRIFALQKKMIQARLKARNQQYDLLTDEQKKELKEYRGGMGYGYHMRRNR